MMNEEEIKVIAMFEAGYHQKEITSELQIAAPTVKSYKRKWDEKKNTQALVDLATKNEVALLSEQTILSDSIKVLTLAPDDKEVLMAQVTELSEGLKGLAILNSVVQVAAIKVTQGIIGSLDVTTTPAQILQLSSALAKLNDTFFNPNNTQINILNQDGGNTQVNGAPFSEYMKD